ncbi:MAG: zf-HC2 domain-containing protein, partial [Oscillospiraceae bacterium]|nr:zf-HC2 domain-containing protein [Oscillospiraceae bacterium]
MRNECNIIRDILPLYAEKIVSEDTAAFVEEHLEHCE